jgi:hypothetical protein
MLFKENITTKEQMVNWLNKRRPTYTKGQEFNKSCLLYLSPPFSLYFYTVANVHD